MTPAYSGLVVPWPHQLLLFVRFLVSGITYDSKAHKGRWTGSSWRQHLNIYLFIYFGCTVSQLRHAGSSLCHVPCGTRDLQLRHVGLFSCGMQTSQLQHACGIQFSDQGLNPGSPHWERGVLPNEPPGKSPGTSVQHSYSHLIRRSPINIGYVRGMKVTISFSFITHSWKMY